LHRVVLRRIEFYALPAYVTVYPLRLPFTACSYLRFVDSAAFAALLPLPLFVTAALPFRFTVPAFGFVLITAPLPLRYLPLGPFCHPLPRLRFRGSPPRCHLDVTTFLTHTPAFATRLVVYRTRSFYYTVLPVLPRLPFTLPACRLHYGSVYPLPRRLLAITAVAHGTYRFLPPVPALPYVHRFYLPVCV